jgi:hypothetical protein
MTGRKRLLAGIAAVSAAITLLGPALAQKPGGILRAGHFDSPASMSMLEAGAPEQPAIDHPGSGSGVELE